MGLKTCVASSFIACLYIAYLRVNDPQMLRAKKATSHPTGAVLSGPLFHFALTPDSGKYVAHLLSDNFSR